MNNITIIIPLYNNKTIINKIFTKIKNIFDVENEIILIDDCSSDDTYNLLKEFINKNSLNNIILLQNEKNMGPSYTRNRGLKMAKGEYIAFLDSDDDWHLQKLDLQINLMKKLDVKISGTLHKVLSHDKLLEEQQKKYSLDKLNYIDISWPKILFVSPFATPSVIIHNSLKNFLFDENIRYSEDYNLWKRITYKHKAIKILLPLTYTFKHDYISDGSSLSSNLYKMQLGVHNSFIKLLHDREINLKDRLLILIAISFSWVKYIKRVVL